MTSPGQRLKHSRQFHVDSGKEKHIEAGSDPYDQVVATYIHLLRQDSPEAAATIEEILAVYGSRAALRATLVITLLKMDALKTHSVEDISIHNYVIKDFPEARPLLEHAVVSWLHDWGIRQTEALGLANQNPTSADEEVTTSTGTLPPPLAE